MSVARRYKFCGQLHSSARGFVQYLRRDSINYDYYEYIPGSGLCTGNSHALLSCATMLHIVHLHAHELAHGTGSPVLAPRTYEEVGIRCSEVLQVSVLSCALSVLGAVLCGRVLSVVPHTQMRRNK